MTAPFRPHVPASETPPELTLRALLLGAILGVVFGAASTYLALRVGLTVSASVPIAVIAIALLRKRGQQRAILEHNITQTAGSAGESVAAAVVFTVPALIFLGYPLEVGLTTLVALTGGCLGVLMMVPLRRYLIVKEHGQLRYPEGKACAEILKAGELGGTSARKVFVGFAVGAALKVFQSVLLGVKGTVSYTLSFFQRAEVACDVDPALIGVGYIIGYRTALMMVAGSLLATFVLIPMVMLFGAGSTAALPPATALIKDMAPGDVWNSYVRHIGAGAVATGGIFALLRALPSIWSALTSSLRSLRGGGVEKGTDRLDRDTPLPVLALGALGIVAFVWLVPVFEMHLLGAVLILGLGFLFAVVSSRITGEVGSTSCPLSGMTIAVLMGTCGVFLLVGWGDTAHSRLALMVGAIVCIAISNAGTCSQDLKTGFLIGATPVRQQGALLVGVLASVLAIGWTAYGLNLVETRETPLDKPFVVAPEKRADAATVPSRFEQNALADKTRTEPAREYAFVQLTEKDLPAGLAPGNYLVDPTSGEARYLRQDGIGSGRLRAPQATLMATVIKGILGRDLPWNLVLIGVAIAVFIELMGFRSLTFAVGVYLPLSSTMPVFLGGLVRKLADRSYGREPDAEDEPEGTLWCSGLIAGASILGILAAMQGFVPGFDRDGGFLPQVAVLRGLPFAGSDLFGALVLAGLGWLMFRGARPRR